MWWKTKMADRIYFMSMSNNRTHSTNAATLSSQIFSWTGMREKKNRNTWTMCIHVCWWFMRVFLKLSELGYKWKTHKIKRSLDQRLKRDAKHHLARRLLHIINLKYESQFNEIVFSFANQLHSKHKTFHTHKQ